MSKKFSQFTEGEQLRQGDIVVGLRDGENDQFLFPSDGIQDEEGYYILKWDSVGGIPVNAIEFSNAITGEAPIIEVTGTDGDIGLTITTKADGDLSLEVPEDGDINFTIGGAGNINFTTPSGYIDMNSTTPITGVLDEDSFVSNSATHVPTQQSTKAYVDSHVAGSSFFISTDLATTGNFSANYDNGASGIGATLTATSNGAASIDGVAVTLDDIILFKNQTDPIENGVYTVTDTGDGSNPAVFTRYILFDQSAETKRGFTTFTLSGNTNAKKGYQLTQDVDTIGTDDFIYQQDTIPALASSTDNAITRWDGTSGGQIQNSTVTLSDAGVINSVTQLNVDNIRIDGNTISSTDGNGNINLTNDGTGKIVMNSTVAITGVLDEDNMASDSPTHVPTQQSVKAYVDAHTGDISDSTFITNTDETSALPNSDPLSAKATGVLASTTTTGALTTRVLTGTANQVNIANGDGSANPTFTLSSTLVTPGTTTLGGTLYVTGQNIEATSGNVTIITDGASAIDLDAPTVLVEQDIAHSGDTNNKITFGTDTQNFQTGGSSRLDISDTGVRLGGSDARITAISDDTTLAADSATLGVTQHAVKTYVDNQAATTANGYFNGSILEAADFQVSSDGATITATLEQDGGGDLSLFFSTGVFVLDCTPAASVTLTAGTDTSPTLNYVYVPISTKVLTRSTSGWPAEEYIPIAIVLCESAATFQTDGAYTLQNLVNDITGDLDSGHSSHIDYWIQNQNPSWVSGVSTSVLANIGVFSISTTSGTVLGLHLLSYPAFNTATGSHVYVPNYTVTPYYRTTDLRTITFTAGGGSLADSTFNLVVWGAVGVDGTQLFINVPTGSYSTLTGAIKDVNRTAVFDFPAAFKGTGFLISRLTIEYLSAGGGQWTLRNNQDLRGLNPATAEGADWGFMSALSDDSAPSLAGDLLTSGFDIHAQGSDLNIVVDTEQLFLDADDIYIPQDLIHTGDTNNKITFGTDTQNFQTGGSSRMDLSDTGMRLGGSDARVTSILIDDTMTGAADTNIYTGLAIRTYVNDTVQPLYDADYITKTDQTSQLTNSIPLSGLATGILASTTTTGALATRVLTGTANQINIANGDGSGNPTYTLSSTLVFPGTATLGGTLNVATFTIASTGANNLVLNAASGQTLDLQENSTSRMDVTSAGVRMGATGARVTSISTDGTLASNSDTLLSTQKAIKTYVDTRTPLFATVSGTSQAMAVNTTYYCTNSALCTLTFPSTAATNDYVEIIEGHATGTFKVAQNSGQQTRFGSLLTTSGATGSITSAEAGAVIKIKCVVANTTWQVVESETSGFDVV